MAEVQDRHRRAAEALNPAFGHLLTVDRAREFAAQALADQGADFEALLVRKRDEQNSLSNNADDPDEIYSYSVAADAIDRIIVRVRSGGWRAK